MSARTVLCYGDSNTHGTCAMATLDDIRRFPRDVRWPGVVQAELGPEWHVIEEGHPGRTTVHDDPIEGVHKNGLTVLPALLETHRPVDLVVVMLGTNDLKARFSVTAFDIAKSIDRLARFILGCESGPGGGAPQVLLVAPVAIEETGVLAEMFEGGRAKSLLLAERLKVHADLLGVPFLDASTLAQVDPVDGVHLTANGQAAIGKGIAEKIAGIGIGG